MSKKKLTRVIKANIPGIDGREANENLIGYLKILIELDAALKAENNYKSN